MTTYGENKTVVVPACQQRGGSYKSKPTAAVIAGGAVPTAVQPVVAHPQRCSLCRSRWHALCFLRQPPNSSGLKTFPRGRDQELDEFDSDSDVQPARKKRKRGNVIDSEQSRTNSRKPMARMLTMTSRPAGQKRLSSKVNQSKSTMIV